MKKIVDLRLNLDGVILDEDETVDGLINKIQDVINSNYDIAYEVVHTEVFE